MQDDISQIGWQPDSVLYQPPWETRFWVLYLLFVFVVCIVKSVRLGRQLWWFWPGRRSHLPKGEEDSRKAQLLAASAMANRRWSNEPALAGGMSEAIVPVTMGLFVCVVLYGAACWYELMLMRRRASWNYFCACLRLMQSTATPNDLRT